jgi:hypothetical protein
MGSRAGMARRARIGNRANQAGSNRARAVLCWAARMVNYRSGSHFLQPWGLQGCHQVPAPGVLRIGALKKGRETAEVIF